jgi:aldehyde:ferredoxin oxidoreductase
VLGRLGLTAIAVRASPVEPDTGSDRSDLTRLLARSPRLRARAEGGTLEVAGALAASGNLGGTGFAGAMSTEDARAWSAGLDTKDRSRKGCAGCPTPCGFVFERGFPGEDAHRLGARFGALFALGPNLGLDRAEDALALLFACDGAALDAIETGAVLALLFRARETGRLPGAPGPAPRSNPEALLGLIEDLVERLGDGRWLALGASEMARELGLASEVRAARGQGARADASLAAILGQCAGVRGSDPMRTFPFLLSDASPARLRELLAPIPLPRGAEDPRDPAGKGRIVWWHENLMAAIDASGFCAFSAAGLLAAGASIVAVARDLNRRFGARVEDDFPPWARADLERPGMWPEYAAMRGLDSSGGPSAETWSRLASESILEVGLEMGARVDPEASLHAPRPASTPGLVREKGRVSLRCSGPLARALEAPSRDGIVRLDVDLPASLREVLAAAAKERPRALRHLLQQGEPIPAAYRASRRLGPDDLVVDGDELDLVVALSGGLDLS